MSRQFRVLLVVVCLVGGVLTSSGPLAAACPRPMTLDDLFAFHRLAAPQISPDGRFVVYQVGTVDLAANTITTALWVAATDGRTPPHRLTSPPPGKRDARPRWHPGGAFVLFESNRSGTSQLWLVPAAGGEPRQLTFLSTGASHGVWSPDGTHVAFVSAVYPEFSDKPFAESDRLNKQKDEEIENNPVKARVFTRLFFRHWDEYVGDKRQHLFVQQVFDAKAEPSAAAVKKSEPRDVTPGDRDAFPTSSTFSSGEDFTFSPDGRYLVFTAVPAENEAWSTNYDLCRVSITNTSAKWETLTAGNPAADSGPQFRPDGKQLAWRAQKTAGYEADKWDILVADCRPDGSLAGPPRRALEKHDLSANEFAWAADGRILFTADYQSRVDLFRVDPAQPDVPPDQLSSGQISSPTTSADGRRFAITIAFMTAPPEIYAGDSDLAAAPRMVSRANRDLLNARDLPRPESVAVPVEGGVKMQMWILQPPDFDPAKKWPVAYLVHGGPQGAWEDGWSWRWNPSLWAAQGYLVVLPNPRGSTGFGQKFTDEITGDWGGKCYRDLVAGLEYVKKLPYVDTDRLAAAGASFGGYMMNWFAVNDIARNFKCLITHCSVWNFESMWGTTDELWFDEWEHGGLPWEKPHKYAEFSPHKRAGHLARYKVPMLVIHNDLDFRCPIGQGHELFTTLQRLGVPSRMVNFPDEGHWVLKPRNSQRWHQEVFAWLRKYAPPGGR